MKLQDQVITIDQAKRLKELGVVQESLFYYNKRGGVIYRDKIGPLIAAAFTVAELGVMLGEYASDVRYFELGNQWSFFVKDIPVGYTTEAQARAAYLIHLLETEQLSIEVVNERLIK